MLELGRCGLDVRVRTLMMVDSLDMTEADRELIAHNCAEAPEPSSHAEQPSLLFVGSHPHLSDSTG